MAALSPTQVQVVGPRVLPEEGSVRVWIDAGSGSGQYLSVLRQHLKLAVCDSGQGSTAIYDLRIFYCRG